MVHKLNLGLSWSRVQHELEAATGETIFVDSSLSDTITTCITMGNHAAAQKIRINFKVSYLL